jgi:3-oxoacyl-[acyl-carrier protein] reductase
VGKTWARAWVHRQRLGFRAILDTTVRIYEQVIPKVLGSCRQRQGFLVSVVAGSMVITGGAGDLGTALALEFRQAGWRVEAPGREQLDVTDPDSVAQFFENRELDLLVCNAGAIRDTLLSKTTEADWDAMMAVNLDGTARCARAGVRTMVKRRLGHVVLISSFSAIHPPAGQVAYAAAKAGLIGFGKSLAKEVGSRGIRANVVLPGFLETRMTENVSAGRREEVCAEHALGRFNTVESVAKFIRCLEEEMPHTSGQVFQLDSRIA